MGQLLTPKQIVELAELQAARDGNSIELQQAFWLIAQLARGVDELIEAVRKRLGE